MEGANPVITTRRAEMSGRASDAGVIRTSRRGRAGLSDLSAASQLCGGFGGSQAGPTTSAPRIFAEMIFIVLLSLLPAPIDYCQRAHACREITEGQSDLALSDAPVRNAFEPCSTTSSRGLSAACEDPRRDPGVPAGSRPPISCRCRREYCASWLAVDLNSMLAKIAERDFGVDRPHGGGRRVRCHVPSVEL